MSTNVNPQAPLEVCPVVLVETVTPDGVARKAKEMLDAAGVNRRPNPANGAPMPKGVKFFA